jgi:hypothetical protein
MSMKHENSSFLSELLGQIGAFVDPLKLIKRIPLGIEINDLQGRLTKIINDYNLQVQLFYFSWNWMVN